MRTLSDKINACSSLFGDTLTQLLSRNLGGFFCPIVEQKNMEAVACLVLTPCLVLTLSQRRLLLQASIMDT